MSMPGGKEVDLLEVARGVVMQPRVDSEKQFYRVAGLVLIDVAQNWRYFVSTAVRSIEFEWERVQEKSEP